MGNQSEAEWVRIDPGELGMDRLRTQVAGGRALCVSRTAGGIGVLDNRCPHQGGPLGDGEIDAAGNVICPWHGYEYDPITGQPPPGFADSATCYAVEERDDGVYVQLPVVSSDPTLMDQFVDVLVEWGLETVFGMVGHSNLGLAEAFRKAEDAGRLRFFGIRHEGAAAFAASGFGKVTGRPAACLSIAGPGATNLLTGLWDAKVDRIPVIALTGQVQTQVLGPGAFQEVPLADAFSAVSAWSQTVLSPDNATELAALAHEYAVISVDVGNKTCAFGHHYECRGRQVVIMSGYLGSIGHGFPVATGAWAASAVDQIMKFIERMTRSPNSVSPSKAIVSESSTSAGSQRPVPRHQ